MITTKEERIESYMRQISRMYWEAENPIIATGRKDGNPFVEVRLPIPYLGHKTVGRLTVWETQNDWVLMINDDGFESKPVPYIPDGLATVFVTRIDPNSATGDFSEWGYSLANLLKNIIYANIALRSISDVEPESELSPDGLPYLDF